MFLREAGLNKSPARNRVFDAWNGVLGPAERKRTKPVRFQRGELLVEVDSSPFLHELANFRGESYRQRANESLGTETIQPSGDHVSCAVARHIVENLFGDI